MLKSFVKPLAVAAIMLLPTNVSAAAVSFFFKATVANVANVGDVANIRDITAGTNVGSTELSGFFRYSDSASPSALLAGTQFLDALDYFTIKLPTGHENLGGDAHRQRILMNNDTANIGDRFEIRATSPFQRDGLREMGYISLRDPTGSALGSQDVLPGSLNLNDFRVRKVVFWIQDRQNGQLAGFRRVDAKLNLVTVVAAVPLPAGLMLLGGALAGLGMIRRRKATTSVA